MKIEFSINLSQFHLKPTPTITPSPSLLSPVVGTELSENLSPQKGFVGKKISCKYHYSMQSITCGPVGTFFFSSNELTKK